MTNPEKAKAILNNIRIQLDKARSTHFHSLAELQGAISSKEAYEKEVENDFGGGFNPSSQRYENNIRIYQQRSSGDLKNFQAWEEVYQYALEVFLNKIP